MQFIAGQFTAEYIPGTMPSRAWLEWLFSSQSVFGLEVLLSLDESGRTLFRGFAASHTSHFLHS